jgi:hypothetical protein
MTLGMRAAQFLRAREYILAHPDESKGQQSRATDISERTIASARAELIAEGLLAPSRKAAPRTIPSEVAARLPEQDPDAVPMPHPRDNVLVDAEAMLRIGAMIDEATEHGDDETVTKLLLKQCLSFAFNPSLHPDTRMSASQMWAKLRDKKTATDLGPGKPKTRTDAVERMRSLMAAVGPEITVQAVHAAFEVKNDPSQNEPNPPIVRPPQVAGPTDYTSDSAAAQDMRAVNMDTGRTDERDQ